MFDRSSSFRTKLTLRVRVTLAGQSPFDADMFVKPEERLIDLMNDQRQFVPLRRADGAMMIVAKSSIATVVEAPDGNGSAINEAPFAPLEADFSTPRQGGAQADDARAHASERPKPDQTAGGPSGNSSTEKEESTARAPRGRRAIDPWEVLRVPRDATLDEVKRAYKARIKSVHPDSLAALDLDADITRAAHLSSQRINHAYERILRELQKADDALKSGAA